MKRTELEAAERLYRLGVHRLNLPVEIKNILIQSSEAREAQAFLEWMRQCRMAHPTLPSWRPEVYGE